MTFPCGLEECPVRNEPLPCFLTMKPFSSRSPRAMRMVWRLTWYFVQSSCSDGSLWIPFWMFFSIMSSRRSATHLYFTVIESLPFPILWKNCLICSPDKRKKMYKYHKKSTFYLLESQYAQQKSPYLIPEKWQNLKISTCFVKKSHQRIQLVLYFDYITINLYCKYKRK